MAKKYQVSMYTDGSCSRNGDPNAVGGYCAILTCKGKEKTVKGYEARTTNNRMELRAVIEGMKALKAPSAVTVYTDSEYVAKNSTSAAKWLAEGTSRANMDLWKQLLDTAKAGQHELAFEHVKGHIGHPYNTRCDKIARQETSLGIMELVVLNCS